LVARQVENVANSEVTLKMAIDMQRTNVDQSLYVRDAAGAAQEHGLNFMEFVIADGTLISSAQYPARVGYKETWVTSVKDWSGTEAFLRREELLNETAVTLTAVRTQPNVTQPLCRGRTANGSKLFVFAGGASGDANAAIPESG
jgi:hypothetical protein